MHALRGHAAALDGDLLECLVGCNRDVRSPERKPLEPHQQLVKPAALAELGLVQLWIDIVMVEHEWLAEHVLPEAGDDEHQVGRIARLHHVEPDLEIGLDAERELPGQRRAVFQRIAESAVGLQRQRMPEHVNAVEDFVALGVLPTERTDHRYRIAGIAQGLRLLPDAAIQRNGQVLDDDQDAGLPAGVIGAVASLRRSDIDAGPGPRQLWLRHPEHLAGEPPDSTPDPRAN